jgi:beta-glucanase (GH16 family)
MQYYTREPENVWVHDSVLTVRAIKESLHGCGYTSARLKTRQRDGKPLFAQRYGRFEFRAQVPFGKGLWPALWLLPQEDIYGNWAASGEIDVLEIVGEKAQEVQHSLHFGSTYPARSLVSHVYKLPHAGSLDQWHVYSVEWEPGEIRFLVDGVMSSQHSFWWSCSKHDGESGVEAARENDINPWPAPFDQPFYILISLAVGGHVAGIPNATTRFPADLRVDYVRVYDKIGGYNHLQSRGVGRMPWQKKR